VPDGSPRSRRFFVVCHPRTSRPPLILDVLRGVRLRHRRAARLRHRRHERRHPRHRLHAGPERRAAAARGGVAELRERHRRAGSGRAGGHRGAALVPRGLHGALHAGLADHGERRCVRHDARRAHRRGAERRARHDGGAPLYLGARLTALARSAHRVLRACHLLRAAAGLRLEPRALRAGARRGVARDARAAAAAGRGRGVRRRPRTAAEPALAAGEGAGGGGAHRTGDHAHRDGGGGGGVRRTGAVGAGAGGRSGGGAGGGVGWGGGRGGSSSCCCCSKQ
jgi:hypothetical protein